MKSYVTLGPHSLTNPSARHLVVEFSHWRLFADGEVMVLNVESSHNDAADAHNAAVALNNREVLG